MAILKSLWRVVRPWLLGTPEETITEAKRRAWGTAKREKRDKP